MKRTCLHKSTNTDEQTACEFHLAEYLVKIAQLEPTENQKL